MDLKEFFLKQRQATHRGTLDVLAKIPPDQLSWRPAPGMLTLAEITRHIWMSEEGIRRAALEGKWDFYEKRVPQGLFAILGEVKSLESEMVQIEKTYHHTLREVAAFPLERWQEERADERFNIRRRESIFLFGINEHEIHHRAQVGAYLHILTGGRASPYPLYNLIASALLVSLAITGAFVMLPVALKLPQPPPVLTKALAASGRLRAPSAKLMNVGLQPPLILFDLEAELLYLPPVFPLVCTDSRRRFVWILRQDHQSARAGHQHSRQHC